MSISRHDSNMHISPRFVELAVQTDLLVVPSLRLVGGERSERGLDVLEELCEELLLGSGLLHGSVGVVHRGVPLVEEEAESDLGGREVLQSLSDGDEVLERLGHLQPVDVQVARVQEVVHRLPIDGSVAAPTCTP